jgi:hypothetical protein
LHKIRDDKIITNIRNAYEPDVYKPDAYEADAYKPDAYKADAYKPDVFCYNVMYKNQGQLYCNVMYKTEDR